MDDFCKFVFKRQYEKILALGDRLERMKYEIDWEAFRPIITKIFYDDPHNGGRPHTDEVLVIKTMVLQAWYGLTDPELEYQIHDRISFRNFLDFPETIPDFTTIWKIRERIKDAGLENEIWAELQRQLDTRGYSIKKGTIQDATFIEADLGKKRHYQEKKARKDGTELAYTDKQKQHQDQDAKFAIKNNQIHYGYKSHIKTDTDYDLIREFEVTTASVHDAMVDLSEENEVVYRDRGYTGTKSRAKGNASMKRGKNLTVKEKQRNSRISKKRCRGERPFNVIKRVFNGARTYVKQIERVRIKEMFKFFAFNGYQLVTLSKRC